MIRNAELSDVKQLINIENSCFEYDRISRRSFRHFLTKGRASLLVAEQNESVVGYVLVLFHRGTSLARLYSIAVDRAYRKTGVAKMLVAAAEAAAANYGCITLRLEIRVDNHASIALFEALGYYRFGRHLRYYEDETDALRLERRLQNALPANLVAVPYYRQTLDFTCGPASLMMAMNALNPNIEPDRSLELQLWRESTTIFMTAGHGGCGPYGLALAASHRDFTVEIYVTEGAPLFIDSVRSQEKKEVIQLVEADFLREIKQSAIQVHNHQLRTDEMIAALERGAIPIILISSWRIYQQKSPHWVVATGHDSHFVYVHDPYIDEEKGKTVTDCANMPITLDEFSRMTRYGKSNQWAALIISRTK